MKKTVLSLSFTLLILISSLVFAGETGKIAGKIIDSATKEPLIGGNVVIVSKWVDGQKQKTNLIFGASSDINGDFFILNIPPGLYDVKVSYVGYKSQIVSKVEINIDKTTTINYALESEDIMTEEVTVVAYSPKTVEPDITASKQVYNMRDVESIAGVADITDILQLQADVVDDHFRGGREGESQYLLSGGFHV